MKFPRLEIWTGRQHIVVTLPAVVFLVLVAMGLLWLAGKVFG